MASEEERLGVDFGALWEKQQKDEVQRAVTEAEKGSDAEELAFDKSFATGCGTRSCWSGCRVTTAARCGAQLARQRHHDARPQQACALQSCVAQIREQTAAYVCRLWTQYKWLIRRYSRSYWRNPPFNSTRLMLALFAALAQGSFYWGKGNNYKTAANVQARARCTPLCTTLHSHG